MLKALLGMAIGEVVPTPDNLASMRQRLPFAMRIKPQLPARLPSWELERDRVEDERYRDAFAPYVDDLRRQLRNLRTRPDLRGRWHRRMSDVFLLFFVIDAGAAGVDRARRLAAEVGEDAYFENELLPRMIARRAGQNAP